MAGSLPPVPTPLHERGARGQGRVPDSCSWAVAAAATRRNKLEIETTVCKVVESHPGYSHSCRVCPVQTTPLESSREGHVKLFCARLDPGKAHLCYEAVPFRHLIKKSSEEVPEV